MEASASHEDRQARYERQVFLSFAESHVARLVLGVATDTIESRLPPYPDIQCTGCSGTYLFELASITGSEAGTAARTDPGRPKAFALSHELPFSRILAHKLKKRYQTEGLGLDLLLYYWQQPPPPQDRLSSMIIAHSQPLQALLDGHFSRIWIFDLWTSHVLSMISNDLPNIPCSMR
jgi:hypothetical protein